MTGNGLKQATLEHIAEFINGGAWNQTEYSDEGVPVVRVTDIKNETVDLSDCKFLPSSSLKRYAKHSLRAGDLVVCTVGSHPTQPGSVVGRAAVIPDLADGALLNQNAVCIRSSSPDVDQVWLGYLGRCRKFHNYIISCARGSANQVRMAIGLLKKMPIEIPPLSVQIRIADILSAYDDLIENNQRRIKILEEMARSLYREWFVNFRFPGHEKVPLVDSPLGKIPKGWNVLEFRDLFDIRYGKTLPQTEIADAGSYPVYGAGDVIGFYDKALFPNKVALVTSRGNGSGTVWRTRQAAFVTNNSLIVLPREERKDWDYSFVELLLKNSDVMQAKTGSAQPQVTIENLNYVKATVPTTSLVKTFCAFVTPIYEQVDLLFFQIQNLRRTRDLLLPRLLSGQVELRGAEAAA